MYSEQDMECSKIGWLNVTVKPPMSSFSWKCGFVRSRTPISYGEIELAAIGQQSRLYGRYVYQISLLEYLAGTLITVTNKKADSSGALGLQLTSVGWF